MKRNCENCKYKMGNWCREFKASTLTLTELKNCIGWRELPKEIKTNTIKRKSIKQEKRLAKDLNAKRTPQSGAQDTSPTDMIKGNYIIESKATKGKSINVKEEWLSSLKQSPMHMGKIPTLILEFPSRKRYVVMDEEDFKNIIKENE